MKILINVRGYPEIRRTIEIEAEPSSTFQDLKEKILSLVSCDELCIKNGHFCKEGKMFEDTKTLQDFFITDNSEIDFAIWIPPS